VAGVISDERPTHGILFGRLQWLMFLRVIFVTVLLGSSILVQFKDREPLAPPLLIIYALIASVYLITFVYVVVLQRLGSSLRFAYIQIGLDTILVTLLIYVTGSIASVFSFLYLVVIVYASILLYKKGSLIMATLCSIQYGLMVGLEYYGLLTPFYSLATMDIQEYEKSYLIYKFGLTVVACFLVAFLSSTLAQQILKTEKQLAAKQKDLEQLEAVNASIIHSIDSGLLTLNPDGIITTFNRAAEVIAGFDRQEVLGKPLSHVFPEVIDQTAFSNTSREKQPYRYEMEFKRKDGSVGYLGFSMSSLEEPGGRPMGKLLIFQDLTPFKNMEDHVKRVEKLAAVGEMAAGIAHEIKNPLASMSGSIQLLRTGVDVTPVAKKLMDIVLRETDRLNALANDFLLFARPRSDKTEPVEINSVIGETLELFKEDGLLENRINVLQDLSAEAWTEMDSEHARQIFWNLLLNAAEAIDGTGRIHVSSKTEEDMVQVIVQDDGCGMSDEAISKIFDPFFTTKTHGTGLGLSIVYRLLESYNGQLDVQSREGRGTTFTVYLRRIDPPGLLS
jgi:two-component system sensor histidine kinase PilS (NtrC family)